MIWMRCRRPLLARRALPLQARVALRCEWVDQTKIPITILKSAAICQ
jgi:hypothetical protein